MLDGLVNGIDRGMRALSEAFSGPVGSYCRLETVDQDALVADDGSLLTVLRLEGSLKHVGADEHDTIISGLAEKLNSTLSKPGHLIQVVYEVDPDSRERIHELFQPSRLTAQNLGMDLSPMFDNWIDALQKYCALEKCWFVLWTRPAALSASLQKSASREQVVSMAKAPTLPGCQQVSRGMAALHDPHGGFVSGVLDAFRDVDLIAYRLSPHEALRDIRLCIDPDFTHRNWKPLIPGDPLPLRHPDPDMPDADQLHHVVYPDFRTQLWPREGHMISRSAVKVGDRIYGPLIMTLMPQMPKPFQQLFRDLARRNERMPYRVSFLLEPDGLDVGIKHLLTSILSFASSDNKRFANAIETMQALDLAGICCIKFRICFCTWACCADLSIEAAHALLRRRMAELSKTIQGWGTCDVSEAIGDPLLGLTATIPGMMPTSPAPMTTAPLQNALIQDDRGDKVVKGALHMLPFRPASPWEAGNLLFRTQDGKIMPFAPNSAEQTAWVELVVSPMGGGKSVFLNALNYAFVTQAGLSRLPWLSIIDVGPSSSGLITLLQESLPPDQKHMAAYHRLRMTSDYAINPFDTPLGLRKPLPSHKSFLVNFVSLFCTGLEEGAAPEKGVTGLLGLAIDLAYEESSDKRKPKKYRPNILPELHELIVRENIPLENDPTWWEVVDALFARGFIHEAHQAQRYAVPLLEDVSAQINLNAGIKNIYNAQMVLDVWRAIVIEGIETYPVLKEPTKFDLGDAQIVSLDLDEVAPRGGAAANRQSAVMYMLARHILGARFFLMPNDVALMPEKYQEYHAARVAAIRDDPKRLCYDEAHRVTKNPAMSGQLVADITTMIREGRKWNLGICMVSQDIDDMPDVIINLATTTIILGAGTIKSIQELAKRFGLNGVCQHALEHLGKPGPAGANFVGLFNTGAGRSQLILTLTIGGQPLWAFSTTTEDVAIRNQLYMLLGPSEALRRLAAKFPGGSAKSEVERRRRLVSDAGSADDAVIDVIKEIIREIAQARPR